MILVTNPPSSGGGGSGNVSGPGSSVDNAVARFDGTGGDTIQNSKLIIGDSGAMSDALSTDVVALTLRANTGGQTNNIEEFYRSNGDLVWSIDNNGAITSQGVATLNGIRTTKASIAEFASGATEFGWQFHGTDGSTNFKAMVGIGANKATTRALIVYGAASQTANLQEWRDSSDTVLSYIAADGTPGGALAGGSGATTALDNLTTTAINASLIPDSALAHDLGASGAEWASVYVNTIYASGNCGAAIFDVENGTIFDPAGVESISTSDRLLVSSIGDEMLDWGTNSDTIEILVNRFLVPTTVTAGGTTGDQTINKMSGTVNFAATATTITVTNSKVSSTSLVFAVVRTNDATATIKNVVPSNGSFIIRLTAAATAETSVGFFIVNG